MLLSGTEASLPACGLVSLLISIDKKLFTRKSGILEAFNRSVVMCRTVLSAAALVGGELTLFLKPSARIGDCKLNVELVIINYKINCNGYF